MRLIRRLALLGLSCLVTGCFDCGHSLVACEPGAVCTCGGGGSGRLVCPLNEAQRCDCSPDGGP